MKDFESEGFDLNDLLECRLTFHARIYIRTDNTKSWWITCKCLTLFKASWWNFDFPPAKSTVGPTHLSFSYFNSCLRSCLPSRWGVKTTLMFQIFSIWVFHHCLYACFYSCCFFLAAMTCSTAAANPDGCYRLTAGHVHVTLAQSTPWCPSITKKTWAIMASR